MKKNTFLIASAFLALMSLSACNIKSDDAHQTASASHRTNLSDYFDDLNFNMESLTPPSFRDYSISITDFGGVGDGLTDNSRAFNLAMSVISAEGGGHIVVPSGIWLTGPISFESNMDLHLEEGAVILFSGDISKYPLVTTSFEGLDTRRCMSPLNAEGKTNIAITGYGAIDGNGEAWRWVKKEKLTNKQWKDYLERGGCTDSEGKIWFPSTTIREAYYKSDMNVMREINSDTDWDKYHDYFRPVLLSFRKCKNVLLQGVVFRDAPAWGLHPLMCENVIMDRIILKNPWHAQNGDGVDIESCKNVLVVNSSFDVGDDAVCIKSGKDEDGRRRNIPCTNVIIDNCTVYHGHGGFTVGSETSGGIKNISVKNCMFLGTDVGLRFKTKRGRGGTVENIYINNINMLSIIGECVLFDMHYKNGRTDTLYNSMTEVNEKTPCFRNIYISNVHCNGARRAMLFNGLPERRILNINVKNCEITSNSGIELNESEGIFLENIHLNLSEGPALKMKNVNNIAAQNVNYSGDIEYGMDVRGDKCGLIEVYSNTITDHNSKVSADSCQVTIRTHE